jgi:hypothetical protein
MQLFTRNKDRAVQSFIIKLINNNCPEVSSLNEGPRVEGRVNLTVVAIVVPVEKRRPVVDRACTAVSKEFSTTGVSLVFNEPVGLDEVFLGFRWERDTTWIRAKAKHLCPMGGGFFQLGLRMTDIVYVGDYPELGSLIW